MSFALQSLDILGCKFEMLDLSQFFTPHGIEAQAAAEAAAEADPRHASLIDGLIE